VNFFDEVGVEDGFTETRTASQTAVMCWNAQWLFGGSCFPLSDHDTNDMNGRLQKPLHVDEIYSILHSWLDRLLHAYI
jgi:hypothetical protein